MAYASIEDVWKRKGTDISDTDYVTALLEDAAIIIDAYNHNATDEAKKLVSCNMVIRTLGSREEGVPIGTNYDSNGIFADLDKCKWKRRIVSD